MFFSFPLTPLEVYNNIGFNIPTFLEIPGSFGLYFPETGKKLSMIIIFSLNFIQLLQVIITPSVTSLLRGENDPKQSDEFQAK